MKKGKNILDTKILNLLIARWSISAKLLAKEIEMPESTFKLKLSETQPAYRFTPLEYIKVLSAVLNMGQEISKTANKELKSVNKKISIPKT